MSVTIKSIAEKAGVSFQAVSAVLNRKGNSRVSVEKRKLIESLAREMGYAPNMSARILSGKRSRLLGVIADTQAPYAQKEAMIHLEAAAAAMGYRILVSELHDDAEQLFSSYRILQQHSVEGTIILSFDYPEFREEIRRFFSGEEHLVFFGGPEIPGASHVLPETAAVIEEAVGRFAAEKRRKIMLCLSARANRETYAVSERIRGFEQGLRGLEGEIVFLSEKDDSPGKIAQAAADLIRERIVPEKFDAVIAQNDSIALALVSRLTAAGVRVPEEISVLGYNNESFCQLTQPGISSVDLRSGELSRRMLDMLLAPEENREPVIRIKPELVIRDSAFSRRGASGRKIADP